MKKSESIAALAKALSQFQAKVKQPLKDKDNPFFKSKYVPLENVVEAITATSGEYGLSFIQFPLNDPNGRVGVTTLLMHESGEWIESEPIFATPAKQDAQGAGSVITYLKRYSLSALFGITSDEDDDGNGAIHDEHSQQSSQAQQQNQQPYRSNIQMPTNPQEAGAIQLAFGKHKGKTLGQIWREDMSYIQWLVDSEKTDVAIREGIGMMQVAAAQQQAQQKMPPQAV
ncbi:ERF family protein [Lysinibacillus parviboronicapiens]|uniref:ERF family protein n=1 Tax=Lysinibacillus parviboronicapiens TaxID=436516 RepID=UPI000D3BC5CD|nr:ERF family protein [Lysinibacillus parviboronicapiens]